MSILEAIVLGIVQGLTEFLPISSTAHLRIVPELFGWSDPGATFSAVIQLGTVLAVLIYFRQDLAQMARALVRGVAQRRPLDDPHSRLGVYILLGTLPIGVAGLVFEEVIKTSLRSLWVIAGSLVVVGLLMAWADRRAGTNKREVRLADALFVGFAQTFALIPGVSRSGATIAAALFRGLDRAEAARFSFLLSVPAISAAGLKELWEVMRLTESGIGLLPLVVGTLFSFVVGYAAIAGLIAFLKRRSVLIFVGYRVALGVTLFALLALNVLVDGVG